MEKIKTFISNWWKPVITVIAILLLMKSCGVFDKSEVEHKKTDNSALIERIKQDSLKIIALEANLVKQSIELIASKHKEDSLKKVADKNRIAYVSLKGSVRSDFGHGICDTVKILETMDAGDAVISSQKEELEQKDTTISKLEDVNETLININEASKGEVTAARTVIKNLTADNKALEKEIIKIKRKGKIKTALLIVGDVIKDVLLIFALK